jgi:cytochrome P450
VELSAGRIDRAAARRLGVDPDDPWLGTDPADPDYREDPAPALHKLREIAPVHLSPLGAWRLSRYDDCARLLRETRCGVRFEDGRPAIGTPPPGFDSGPGEFMLQQDPPKHTRLRRLVSKAFTPRAVEAKRQRVRENVRKLLDAALERGEMDVIADLALPVPSTVICEMMGVPLEDRTRFTAWTGDATHLLAAEFSPEEVVQRGLTSAGNLALYFQQLIEARRGRLTDDLLSELIRAEESGDRLSPSELLVQSIGLLIAGFETTIGLIGNGVYQLARHPGELERLRREPELVRTAVDECLRFDGPIGATLRILHEEADFGGIRLPRDARVVVMLDAADRDPAKFPDPDRLDVGRSPNEHLAFGGGAHLCLGAHLARMEAQEAIGALATRTREIELLSEKRNWGRSLFRVPGELPVRLRPA